LARKLDLRLLLALLLAMAVRAYGGSEVIGMELHGVLTTQVATTPGARPIVTEVSNSTIINDLISTGAASGIPRKNLMLVHLSGFSNILAVINTGSNNAIVATIRTPSFPSSASFSDVQKKPGSPDMIRITNPDFEITIPGVSGIQRTMATENFVVVSGTHMKSVSVRFFGGQGSGTVGSTQFIGTAHSTGKYFAN